MKTFLNSVVEVSAADFTKASESIQRQYISDAVWANVQWLIFLHDSDFQELKLVNHEYFGNCHILKDDNNYTISYSKWGYEDQQYFDSKIVIKIGDHFAMLRSLLYRLAPNENFAGNLFDSYITYFEEFLGENITGMSARRAIEFLDMCQFNRPMFSVTMHFRGSLFNYHISR